MKTHLRIWSLFGLALAAWCGVSGLGNTARSQERPRLNVADPRGDQADRGDARGEEEAIAVLDVEPDVQVEPAKEPPRVLKVFRVEHCDAGEIQQILSLHAQYAAHVQHAAQRAAAHDQAVTAGYRGTEGVDVDVVPGARRAPGADEGADSRPHAHYSIAER